MNTVDAAYELFRNSVACFRQAWVTAIQTTTPEDCLVLAWTRTQMEIEWAIYNVERKRTGV